MSVLRTLVRGRFSRDLWGVAALLFALALAGSIVMTRLAVDREEAEALSRAGTVADSTIAPVLTRGLLGGALEGTEAEPLRVAVREAVLADPRIVRVRIWRPDGTLLFSTDPRDDVGRVIPPIDVRITDAVEGTPTAGVSGADEARRGLSRDAEPVLRSFVPLTVEAPPPAAVAEIDFRHADLVAAASAPWRPVQVALGAGLALALGLLAASMRTGIEPPAGARPPSGAPAAEPQVRRAPPTAEAEPRAEDAAALARKLKQAEARIGALEGEIALLTNQLRRAEMERADGRAIPGVAQAVREAEEALARADERLREAEARAAQAEARAKEAEARAAQAEARAKEAEADAERARAEARAAADVVVQTEARAAAAERERAALGERLRRAEQAAAEARARLEELATAGAGEAVEAATAELQARIRQAEERARQAEERARRADALDARLREAQDRLAEAEQRLREGRAPTGQAQPGLAALEERLQAAEARARRAEELLEELHLALSAASLPPEAGELRERLARAGSTRHRHEAQEPEAAIRGAIVQELRSALARVLGASLTLKAAVGTAEGQEALRHLHAATRRLDRLVADFQDAAKLADGSLPLRRRRTDLEALVQRVVGEAEGLEQHVVELDTRLAKATVDAARVEQILEAVLDAVAARGAPGSGIRVVLAPGEGAVTFSVEDAGPVPGSVPPELTLAARLAELHGGRLWVEERPGGGTAFRVSLPDQPPEAPGSAVAAASPDPARPQIGRGSTA